MGCFMSAPEKQATRHPTAPVAPSQDPIPRPALTITSRDRLILRLKNARDEYTLASTRAEVQRESDLRTAAELALAGRVESAHVLMRGRVLLSARGEAARASLARVEDALALLDTAVENEKTVRLLEETNRVLDGFRQVLSVERVRDAVAGVKAHEEHVAEVQAVLAAAGGVDDVDDASIQAEIDEYLRQQAYLKASKDPDKSGGRPLEAEYDPIASVTSAGPVPTGLPRVPDVAKAENGKIPEKPLVGVRKVRSAAIA
jgi:Snf7